MRFLVTLVAFAVSLAAARIAQPQPTAKPPAAADAALA